MRKQLSAILRSWADRLCPEQSNTVKIGLCEYRPQKIAMSVEIGKRVAEKCEKLIASGMGDKLDDAMSIFIKDAKEYVKACIIKTIEGKNLIEYDIDRENMIVSGELKIWTKS